MTLKIKRDNTPTIAFQVYNPDGSECDLSSVQDILFLAKTDQSLPNSQASITKSKSGGQITVPAAVPPHAAYIFQFKLLEADTKAILVRTTFYCDALVTDSTGNLDTVGDSVLVIDPNIARAP